MSEYSSFFSEPSLEGSLPEDIARAYVWAEAHQGEIDDLAIDIRKCLPYIKNTHVSRALYDCAVSLLMQEDVFGPLRPPREVRAGEWETYRTLLYQKRYLCEERDYLVITFTSAVSRMLWFAGELEPIVAKQSPFTVPLYTAVSDLPEIIDEFYREAWDGGRSLFFFRTKTVLHRNRLQADEKAFGKVDPEKIAGPARTELQPHAMVETYLRGTQFLDLLTTPVPLQFSKQERLGHHLILGGSGAGKTSVIEHCLVHDLTSSDRPSVILIDPHSDLVNRLLKADLGLKDRLVYINPRDIEFAPQLNVFAPNTRMNTYDAATQEQVTTAAIETLEYLFSGLFDLALTGRQAALLPYLTRLMLAFPAARGENATLFDLLAVTESITPFMDVVAMLDPLEQQFFERDFIQKYKDTRQQIQSRLQAIAGNMTLRRLFGSRETKIDLFDALNSGSVILIDTAEDFLGSGSAMFGRLWISFILQAILERSALPESKRRTTYLYIDEAMTYFDEKLAKLLREVRKYGCGAVLASQELPNVTAIRSALSANTSVKMACMVGAGDAGTLAPDMRTSREFILSQPRLQFASFIQGVTTGGAIAVAVKPGLIDSLPKISDEAYDALIAENRQNVSIPRTPQLVPRVASAPRISPPASDDRWTE